jgi:hypothetical protein
LSFDGNQPVSGDPDQGTEPTRSAEALPAQAQAGADAQAGTGRAVLALYRELRHQRPEELFGMGIFRPGTAARRHSHRLGDHEPGS